MESVKTILQNSVELAFESAGYDRELGKVTVSNRPDLCDYQSNGALIGAKKYGKNPVELAEDVKKYLEGDKALSVPLYEKIEVVKPGFLNFTLSPAFLAKYCSRMAEDDKLGLDPKEGQTILIDYGGANVAKPLHVGHLRSASIGETLKRLAIRMGNDAVGDVHLGDFGLQMGLIIGELEDRGELDKDFTISELEEVYPYASAKAKEKNPDGSLKNEAYAERAREITAQLQKGVEKYKKAWEKILKVSIADLKKNYGALDVHFEIWKGESDAEPYFPRLIEILEEKGLSYRSNGALVVDIAEPEDKKELPPCMILKSDGASLYSTSDLGTIMDREKCYPKDWYLYIADSRQDLHYTSFFRVARKADLLPKTTKMNFLGFGTMNGKDGKPFKTRDGGVLRLEKLIEEIQESVLKRMEEGKDTGLSEEERKETAKVIALAALKYGDLSNQITKDYIFDLEKFTAFEGNTGPYILYTIVRIASILRKYAEAKGEKWENTAAGVSNYEKKDLIHIEDNPSLQALEKQIVVFSDEMKDAWKELAPHKICGYIYALANSFNAFYHNVKILGEEDQEKQKNYIAHLALTWRILTDAIQVLGFSAPERM